MTTAVATTRQATLAEMRQQPPAPVENHMIGLTSTAGFELAQRAAKLLASSTLVPKEYQGNLPNCVIALNMSARIGADPLLVMQNLVIVHGRPTWSAQFLIATVNTSGRFTALRYEFFGTRGKDDWGCRAWAIEKATGEKLVGTDVTIAIAKKEGWYGKNGSKWQSIPQQMLMYRAGSWWTRAYAPELSMGLHTADEMSDVYDAELAADGTYRVTTDDIRQAAQEVETQDDQVAAEVEEVGDEPFTFTDNYGECTEFDSAGEFVSTFVRALGEAETSDAVDGLWETNSPLLQRVRATEGGCDLATQAAETYDASLHRVAKPAQQEQAKPANKRQRANLFNGEE